MDSLANQDVDFVGSVSLQKEEWATQRRLGWPTYFVESPGKMIAIVGWPILNSSRNSSAMARAKWLVRLYFNNILRSNKKMIVTLIVKE